MAQALGPLFADSHANPHGRKLLLLTKSANVQYLEGLPTKNVVVSFSLNPQPIADVFEGCFPDGVRITPDISVRVQASEKARAMGYETRWRVDPIIPIDGWEDAYSKWFKEVSYTRPTRITFGTYREMTALLRVFAKGWGLPPMPWKPACPMVPDGRHRQLPRPMRIEIYKKMKDFVEAAWGPSAPNLALCKERTEVRQESGINSPDCNCAP
jgi:DNA repair photolyase